MKKGDWVIIHGTSTVYDGREGRITAIDGGSCYVTVNGTKSRVAKRYLRVIKENINYLELLNQALLPFDEDWAKEIAEKMKEVKT